MLRTQLTVPALLCIALAATFTFESYAQKTTTRNVKAVYSSANGIGPEKGVMRRDPSDIIKVDDACLIVRDGKYWFYYKGRQLGRSPAQTKMGVAIAEKPQAPYIKYKGNPVIPGNHEVLVWPQGKGVAAMIGMVGPENNTRSILYAEDGLHFSRTHLVANVPTAVGAYRPEAFTESGTGKLVQWGVHIGKQKRSLPFIQRFDLVEAE